MCVGGGGGGTDSLSWGIYLESTAPSTSSKCLLMCSPLFSWMLKESPFKLSHFYKSICLFDLILLTYLFLYNFKCKHFDVQSYMNNFENCLWVFIMTKQPLPLSKLDSNFTAIATQQSGLSRYHF